MNISSGCCRLLLAGVFCLLGACAKSPEEVEAERARANAQWNADVERAERERQLEEKRLVEEEVAAHERQVAADEARAKEAEQTSLQAEQERLIQLVRARTPNAESAAFSNVHWNATRSALCGEVQGMRFVASGDQAEVESAAEAERARFTEFAQTIDCSP